MSGYKPAEQIARDIAARCEPPPELRDREWHWLHGMYQQPAWPWTLRRE